MRGVFVVSGSISNLNTARTLLLGTSHSKCVLEIYSVRVGDLDQNAVEQLQIGLFRVSTLGTIAGSQILSPNVERTEIGTAFTNATWYLNLTTEPTTYLNVPLDMDGNANVAGYSWVPLPEERPIISPSDSFGLRLLQAPTNPFKAQIVLKYREIGGGS